MVVIGCNTASACAYNEVKDKYDIPIIEVVRAGSMAAVEATKNGKIGVIGTPRTIESGIYEQTIRSIRNDVEVYSTHCSLFVSLAEEGWWDNDISLEIAKKYLSSLTDKGIDTLVLGCTHYPLLEPSIRKAVGDDVTLISSGKEVAKVIESLLDEDSRNSLDKPECEYYTSDSVDSFIRLGEMFLGQKIEKAKKVEF